MKLLLVLLNSVTVNVVNTIRIAADVYNDNLSLSDSLVEAKLVYVYDDVIKITL